MGLFDSNGNFSVLDGYGMNTLAFVINSNNEEGQELLDSGYQHGKQYYNITKEGKIVKFQPDNSPDNGYHSYQIYSPPDIPPTVLKQMYKDGKITKSDYKKLMKGKKK